MAARPNFRSRQLARELSRLRRQASLNQAEAGKPARFSVKKMSRIEQGQLPDYNGLRVLLDVYGVPVNDWEPYIRIWELAQEKGWWHGYGLDDQNYVSMEHESSMLRELQFSFVPGLLQTEDYMRSLFQANGLSKRLTNVEVEVRLRRQTRLDEGPPLEIHTVIDEAVLKQGVAPAVMHPQLLHLINRAETPNVKIQVLPRSLGLHPGLAGTFTLLSFPAAEDKDQLYVEHASGALHIEEEAKVTAASRRFDKMCSLALSPHESAEMLRRLAAAI